MSSTLFFCCVVPNLSDGERELTDTMRPSDYFVFLKCFCVFLDYVYIMKTKF